MKKMKKINCMANIITFLVSNSGDLEDEKTTLNIALKYRTPRTLEYYINKYNSK